MKGIKNPVHRLAWRHLQHIDVKAGRQPGQRHSAWPQNTARILISY